MSYANIVDAAMRMGRYFRFWMQNEGVKKWCEIIISCY